MHGAHALGANGAGTRTWPRGGSPATDFGCLDSDPGAGLWRNGSGMADIGRPQREIEVRPAELPLPRELPIEPPVPVPEEPSPVEEPVPA